MAEPSDRENLTATRQRSPKQTTLSSRERSLAMPLGYGSLWPKSSDSCSGNLAHKKLQLQDEKGPELKAPTEGQNKQLSTSPHRSVTWSLCTDYWVTMVHPVLGTIAVSEKMCTKGHISETTFFISSNATVYGGCRTTLFSLHHEVQFASSEAWFPCAKASASSR